MTVSVKPVHAVEMDRLKVHAEAHARWIHRPCAAAPAIDDGVHLQLAIKNGAPLITASAKFEIVACLKVSGALQELLSHSVGAEFGQHGLRFIRCLIDGIVGIRLDERKRVVIVSKISADRDSNLPEIVHASGASGALDQFLVLGHNKHRKDPGDGHHQHKFDKRESPDSARSHDLVGAPFACSFRRM